MTKVCILDRDPAIADNRMIIQRNWIPNILNPSTYKTNDFVYSIEVSVYYYLKKYHKKLKVDLIPWEKITDHKLMKSYDKIFIFNHGLSDAFPFWKNKTNKYEKAWKQLGERVWPSYKFASFVLDKCKYYKFLNENGINTAETFCVSNKNNIPKLYQFLNDKKINKLFVKPVGGNSGFGTSTHMKPYKNLKESLSKSLKTWNKLVIQRYMNFSTHESPEYKCLYVGGKLQYIVKTFKLGYFHGIILPQQKTWSYLRTIKTLNKKVIKLFSKKMKTTIPYCRIDWGFDKINKRFFLNEFEHAGGNYGDNIVQNLKKMTPENWKVDVALAKAIKRFMLSKNKTH